jgi:hypothetical protein
MKTADAIWFVAGFALFTGACSSDKTNETSGAVSTGGSGGATAVGATGAAGKTPAAPGTASGGQGGGSVAVGSAPGSTANGGSPAPIIVAGNTPVAIPNAGPVDVDFDTCYADVHPTCSAHDMNTGELMQTPCRALTMVPVPLTDGSNYGPITLQAGPYGGKAEWNQGSGTEFANPVNPMEPICVPIGIETFMEPAATNAEIENLRGVDYSLYTIFRPACFKPGEKYPVITWANGTCGEIAGYAPLLSTVASYGFVIVASNSTWTATTPTDKVQLRALDYAKSLNEDPTSLFYQRLDMDKVGAMGHSQGAMATKNADSDPRIKSVIFWNTGNSNNKPFLNVSGERDVVASTPASMASDAAAATMPGAWTYYHQVLQTGGTSTGHLVLMEQPDRVVDMAVAWWKWQLNGDTDAKKMFVGDGCGLCGKADQFDYGQNPLLQ